MAAIIVGRKTSNGTESVECLSLVRLSYDFFMAPGAIAGSSPFRKMTLQLGLGKGKGCLEGTLGYQELV
jgi:hypothetical protein